MAASVAVHPRLCGEHCTRSSGFCRCVGSSPPVRGTREHAHRTPFKARFIPACAGNTRRRWCRPRAGTVHPRLCGEHRAPSLRTALSCGSSPPVRGTRSDDARAAHTGRFIPACAGNTHLALQRRRPQAVHPRLCGEHGRRLFGPKRVAGSSPPVRGTRSRPRRRARRRRFIPACAGNTFGFGRAGATGAVHPRLCGEHVNTISRNRNMFGSSPPVRGTRTGRGGERLKLRFIPACAGNTPRDSERTPSSPVHPRLCGEHYFSATQSTSVVGSSPPVRGTPPLSFFCWRRPRFIPACAGNTPLMRRDVRKSAVHPRLCGEHDLDRPVQPFYSGSSPPVRGTQSPRERRADDGRFIPACAGNTGSRRRPCRIAPVHPRLCGEHFGPDFSLRLLTGSSPPVRGTPPR